MARISGVDLPNSKRIEIGLTYIYGIGRNISNDILTKAKIDKNVRVSDLTDEQVNKIRTIIEKEYQVEGDLRKEIAMNIKRLIDIGAYRGLRHKNNQRVPRVDHLHLPSYQRDFTRNIVIRVSFASPV